MKTTAATKNVRQRFFYIARRKITGLFGPLNLVGEGRPDDGPSNDDGPMAVTPPLTIYTAPTPATQRPVNSNARDRKNYKRNVFGGIVKEKGK